MIFVTPLWLIGNPFGPVPYDLRTKTKGKYFYMNEFDKRIGPFHTYEEAKSDMDYKIETPDTENN